MKSVQEMAAAARKTVEVVVETLSCQFKNAVRLLSKQPKTPPLSWESIIGEEFSARPHQHVAIPKIVANELPEVNLKLAQLPFDVFEELLRRLQKNVVDEVQAIRLYEKLFDCEVLILRGHVHFYRCRTEKGEETIDYTELTGRLIGLFAEHKEIVLRRGVS